jgi:hypothetical protein
MFRHEGYHPKECALMHDLQSRVLYDRRCREKVLSKGGGSGFVNLFSMSYTYDKNDEGMAFEPTDEAIVSYPVAP